MTSDLILDSAREVLERSVGLRLDPAQRHHLEYWLKTTAAQRGISDSMLVNEIAGEGPALQALLDELTVQETSFFRDRGQFDGLRCAVLGTLDPPLTVWSAGCAWGHEPYSLAMLLDEVGYPEWRVVASDISSRALKQAASGRFSDHQLTGLTEEERSRYLIRVGDGGWEVIPRLHERVTVFRHNLVRDPVPRIARGAGVVFCRNVLIYFDRPDVLRALDVISETMDPVGWTFLGYSESLWQVTESFRLVRVGKAFAYRQSAALPQPVPGSLPPEFGAPAAKPAAATPTRRRPAPGREPVRDAALELARRSDSPRFLDMLGAQPASSHDSVQPAPSDDSAKPVPSVAALLAEGEAALQAGDPGAAVHALRKAAYLDPDHGVAQFQLGLAFELLGDTGQARRAFGAARVALTRSSAAAEAALEGYQISELTRLLDHRLKRAR